MMMILVMMMLTGRREMRPFLAEKTNIQEEGL